MLIPFEVATESMGYGYKTGFIVFRSGNLTSNEVYGFGDSSEQIIE